MKTLKLVGLLASLSLTSISHAELLWDNGVHDNVGNGVNNQYQSVMDDFYVPGAGWFVNSAETHGIFLNSGRTVSDVDITIWPADLVTGEPNGDTAFPVPTINFNAADTGENWEGYDVINVTVNFDNTFLDGQEYYFLELDIKDQYGERIKLIERQSISYQPAHTGPGANPINAGVDLAFKLSGTDIKVIDWGMPGGFKVESLDSGSKVVSLQIAGNSKQLDPGLYQMNLLRNIPILYHFDQNGNKQLYDFAPNPKEPARFSTPLGDDLCGEAEGSLAEYCQSFVACVAYELWCPGL
jgi:hypothetical protein